MTASYSYAPLGELPTRSLRDSRLFDLDAPPPPLSRFRILTRPKALLATISVALLIVYFVYNPPVRRSERDNRLIEAGFDPDARFEALYKAGQAGWRPYDGAEDCEEEEVNEQIWVDKLTATCLEDLGAKGVLCEEAAGLFRQPAVDLVWTWTNGSDPLLYRWRADVTATLSDRVRPAIAAVRERKTANHFRFVLPSCPSAVTVLTQSVDSMTSCAIRFARLFTHFLRRHFASSASSRPTCRQMSCSATSSILCSRPPTLAASSSPPRASAKSRPG